MKKKKLKFIPLQEPMHSELYLHDSVEETCRKIVEWFENEQKKAGIKNHGDPNFRKTV